MLLIKIWFLFSLASTVFSMRPNIVIIVADDMGWDDAGYHGSQLATPNADLLAFSGVALGRYYTHCVCTPSRAALLTGKFGHTTGMHGYPLTMGEDRGLSINQKILPQYLKEMGYATHLVGKWHLGQSRTAYMPTSRGFDTFLGHKGGAIDYYEYSSAARWEIGSLNGFDFVRNTSPAWDIQGYVTDVYTDEAKSIIMKHNTSKPLFLMVSHNAVHSAMYDGMRLQAPSEEVRAHRYVESTERRVFAAMLKKLDDSLGEIIESVLEKEILDNTIVVFISDNGGMTSTDISRNFASNWPLRGLKLTPFEGGIRVPGFIWSPNMKPLSHLWNGYMHVVDWLPTILSVVGGTPPSGIDGIDQWHNIISNSTSSRKEFFEISTYTSNNIEYKFRTIVSGDFKLVMGNVDPDLSNHQGGDLRGIIGYQPLYENILKKSKMHSILTRIGQPVDIKRNQKLKEKMRINCKNDITNDSLNCTKGSLCLFNIKEDPCETKDISQENPFVVKKLLLRLLDEVERVVPRSPVYNDLRAQPRFFNYTWSQWADGLPVPSSPSLLLKTY